jgi:uncharacterized protein YjbI with pentapeptide repeats
LGEDVSSYVTHAEILSRGATAWNAWREQNPCAVPDLKGVSLTLREDWLNRANLREARLQNSVLRFAALSTADLEAADMSGADLMHAQLDQANLRAVNLGKARLDHAHLAGAILTNANLCGARLRFATLSTADLQAADMSDADLMHARLDHANLSAANLKNARLDYADFAGAELTKVNLCGARLRHAKNLTRLQLEECTGNTSTILPSHLHGSVPWSPVVISPTIERFDPRALPRVNSRLDDAHLNSGNPQRLNLYDPQRWGSAAVVTIAALVITAFIWEGATMLDGQWRSEQSTTESSFPPEALSKTKSAPEALVESARLDFVPTPRAAWPHAIVPNLSSNASAALDLAHRGSLPQEVVSFGDETLPNWPSRNPARGQDIETAAIRSNAAKPPIPVRNPLR